MTTGGDDRGPEDRAPVLPGKAGPSGEVAGDSGQIEYRPDGSVSIPIFEEELVCEKRLVVRERIVVRKETVTEDRVVEADLRRERVAVDPDPAVSDRVEDVRSG